MTRKPDTSEVDKLDQNIMDLRRRGLDLLAGGTATYLQGVDCGAADKWAQDMEEMACEVAMFRSDFAEVFASLQAERNGERDAGRKDGVRSAVLKIRETAELAKTEGCDVIAAIYSGIANKIERAG